MENPMGLDVEIPIPRSFFNFPMVNGPKIVK